MHGGRRHMKRSSTEFLGRIERALQEAVGVLSQFVSGKVRADRKPSDRSLITEADRSVNRVLQESLQRDQEGWLSEESTDNLKRLKMHRVWVVDPLDGTREFVTGIPEWSVSVALVVDGGPVPGGICNPARGETFLGASGHGVTLNGAPVRVSARANLAGAAVLASRTAVGGGQGQLSAASPFTVVAMGSVAYKLARVAAGLADATWTLVPKHEWDVAAGVALVLAAGGRILAGTPEEHRFNRPEPLLTRLIAAPPQLLPEIEREIARRGFDNRQPSASGGRDR